MSSFSKILVLSFLIFSFYSTNAQNTIVKKEDISIFCKKAEVAMQQKQYNVAYDNFTKAINLKPNPKLYSQRASCLMIQKSYQKALQDCDSAIKLNPNYSQAFFIKATILQFENKTNEAIVNYTNTISINPKYIDAYIMRGLLYATLKNKSEACNDLHKAKQLGSTEAKIHLKDICGY